MADTAIGLLQGDEPTPGQRITELEHALQVAANKIAAIGYQLDIRDPRHEEVLAAANDALCVLDR